MFTIYFSYLNRETSLVLPHSPGVIVDEAGVWADESTLVAKRVGHGWQLEDDFVLSALDRGFFNALRVEWEAV